MCFLFNSCFVKLNKQIYSYINSLFFSWLFFRGFLCFRSSFLFGSFFNFWFSSFLFLFWAGAWFWAFAFVFAFFAFTYLFFWFAFTFFNWFFFFFDRFLCWFLCKDGLRGPASVQKECATLRNAWTQGLWWKEHLFQS